MVAATTKAYIAGFLDGEGYIGISNIHCPRVEFINTNRDILEFIKSVYGGDIRVRKHPNHPLWKDGYELDIQGVAKVKNILLSLYPYIKLKKIQSKEVINYISNRTYNKTITDSELEYRNKCYYKLRMLNKKGK